MQRSDNDPAGWEVYVGRYHCTQSDPTEHKVNVVGIVPHPAYNNSTLENDIALLISEVNTIAAALMCTG